MIIEAQDSKMVRLLAFFPLFISGFFFAFAHSHNGGVSKLFGVAFLIIGLWTCLARRLQYIDTIAQTYGTRSNWLWMRWSSTEPLSHFSHIGIVFDSSTYPGETRNSSSYEVCLFRGSTTERPFEIFNTRDQALTRATYIAQHTGLPFIEN